MMVEANSVRARGFTIIELTVVIVVVGVLAVVAVAKLTRVDSFQVYGFFDSARSAVRFAQKIAVAQRTNVVVVLAPASISVCYTSAACALPVTDPATGQAMTLAAPAGVSITGPASLSFDGLGRASPGGTITVNGAGVSRSLIVEQETGYVHD
ncbi:MAG: prepilin-type N-terminal cleavage/methylation domain-containing protein [Burkholderiales bacterium]